MNGTCHFFVDVENPEEGNYDTNVCHVNMDSTFWIDIKIENENNINEFFSLPELSLAKKYETTTFSILHTDYLIMTFRNNCKGPEEVHASKEATTFASKKKEKKGRGNKRVA